MGWIGEASQFKVGSHRQSSHALRVSSNRSLNSPCVREAPMVPDTPARPLARPQKKSLQPTPRKKQHKKHGKFEVCDVPLGCRFRRRCRSGSWGSVPVLALGFGPESVLGWMGWARKNTKRRSEQILHVIITKDREGVSAKRHCYALLHPSTSKPNRYTLDHRQRCREGNPERH